MPFRTAASQVHDRARLVSMVSDVLAPPPARTSFPVSANLSLCRRNFQLPRSNQPTHLIQNTNAGLVLLDKKRKSWERYATRNIDQLAKYSPWIARADCESDAAFNCAKFFYFAKRRPKFVACPLPVDSIAGGGLGMRSYFSVRDGLRTRYSIQTVQSGRARAGKAQEGPLDFGVRHSNARLSDAVLAQSDRRHAIAA